jgi:hypothetical protein
MPKFLVLGVLSPPLSSDGEGKGCNRLLYDGPVEDEGDNFSINIFIDMMT